MLFKLFFSRVLPVSILYYVSVQVYVVYIISNGNPRQVAAKSIDIRTLPHGVQVSRTELVQDMVDFYNAKPNWRHFHEDFILEDPLVRQSGIESVARNIHFWETYAKAHEINATLKSVVHYKDSIKLDFHHSANTRFGMVTVNLSAWLELGKYGDSEKVVRLSEEWNGVPNISHENTLFPVGWSAEMMRVILGKIVLLLPL